MDHSFSLQVAFDEGVRSEREEDLVPTNSGIAAIKRDAGGEETNQEQSKKETRKRTITESPTSP